MPRTEQSPLLSLLQCRQGVTMQASRCGQHGEEHLWGSHVFFNLKPQITLGHIYIRQYTINGRTVPSVQDVMTVNDSSIRKDYRSRLDLSDVVSVTKVLKLERNPQFGHTAGALLNRCRLIGYKTKKHTICQSRTRNTKRSCDRRSQKRVTIEVYL